MRSRTICQFFANKPCNHGRIGGQGYEKLTEVSIQEIRKNSMKVRGDVGRCRELDELFTKIFKDDASGSYQMLKKATFYKCKERYKTENP